MLEISVNQWRADFSYDNLYDDGIEQERLRVWFQQNVYQNPLLMKLWRSFLRRSMKQRKGFVLSLRLSGAGVENDRMISTFISTSDVGISPSITA